MIENIRWPEDNNKIGFPVIPEVPNSWLVDGNFEDQFADKLSLIQARYDQNRTPYLDKDTERVRTSEISENERMWFAGFMDEGTRFDFDRNGKYYYPVIARSDVDSPQRALALLRLGGNIQTNDIKQNPDELKTVNWHWYTRGDTALRISETVAPDLLYKGAQSEQFLRWKETIDLEERKRIAIESKNLPEATPGNIDNLHPAYVAGLFDSSGVIGFTHERKKLTPNVQLYFRQKELMEYIHNHFRGTTMTRIENKNMTIYNKQFYSENTQYIWRAQQTPALDFLSYIRPYVWLNSGLIDEVLSNV